MFYEPAGLVNEGNQHILVLFSSQPKSIEYDEQSLAWTHFYGTNRMELSSENSTVALISNQKRNIET